METVKYDYETAYGKCLEFFKGDELAAGVTANKYLLRDRNDNFLENSPNQLHDRVADELVRIENNYPNSTPRTDIHKAISEFIIIMQGSPLYGIGNNQQVSSLSNCYTISSPLDSYSSIIMKDMEIANIFKRRGGAGLCLSNIRPRGAPVSNSARTSDGIVCFMERYSNTTKEVSQSGRRGASLLTLSCYHPDILDFICVKRDLKRITGANISVKWTDEFMMAVKNDTEIILRFPVDVPPEKASFTKKVKARDIWKEFVKSNHQSAEPGFLNWTSITSQSLSDCYEGYETVCCNPCQPDFATVLTPMGIRTFKDIDVGSVIWSKEGWTTVINKQLNGIKPVIKYKTNAGTFVGTDTHRVVSNEQKIEVRDASTIDVAKYSEKYDVEHDVHDIMDGLMIGDGSIHLSSLYKVYLIIGEDDYDYFESEIGDLIIERHAAKKSVSWKVHTSITPEELPRTYLRSVPDRFLYGDKNKVCSFLRGLFTANGSICGNRVTLKTSSPMIAEQVVLMLNSIGIGSYVTYNKPSSIKWKNGIFTSKKSYTVNITSDRKLFYRLIGFIQKYKMEKLKYVIDNTVDSRKRKISYEIIEKELIGDFNVYDITVDNQSHTYWTGGLDVCNCSELPLSAYSQCLLTVVNLTKFIDNPFAKNAEFNRKEFIKYVRMGLRLIDDLVDLEIEKLTAIVDKIKNDAEPDEVKQFELDMWNKFLYNCKNVRRVGLGITGFADMLAYLNLKYDSTDALKFTEDLFRTFHETVMDEDAELARERGKFQIYDWEREKDCHYIKILPEKIQKKIKEHGRRNISVTTCSPAGSISILAQCSSGIEPIFKRSYVRRRKLTSEEIKNGVRIDSTDNDGIRWTNFNVSHHGLEKWKKMYPDKDIKDSPYWNCEAGEISWKARIKVQGVIGKYITHAISSTCNLPSTTTEEEVNELYMMAWKEGLKGVTIYREGSRQGVMMDKNDKLLTFIKECSAPRRPPVLPCEIHYSNIQGNAWILFVGLMDGRPFEIMGGKKKNIEIPKKYKTGWIQKNSKNAEGNSTYDLILGSLNETDEQMKIKDIVSEFTPDAGSYTRIISGMLSHGIPIKFIVEQLRKDSAKAHMFCWEAAIARILKKYIKDGEPTSEQCPQCKTKLVYKDGCVCCMQCQWSKCS